MMRPFTVTITCCAVGLAVLLSGCGQKQTQPPSSSASPAVTATPGPSASPGASAKNGSDTTSPGQTELKVKGFFADQDGSKLVQKELTVRYAKEENKYTAVLNALKKSPSADAVSLFPSISFHTATLKSGTLTVDMSLPDEARLGSGGEALFLDALKQTLFQFSEVQAIELLVDGEKVESLMGHLDLPHPIKRKAS